MVRIAREETRFVTPTGLALGEWILPRDDDGPLRLLILLAGAPDLSQTTDLKDARRALAFRVAGRGAAVFLAEPSIPEAWSATVHHACAHPRVSRSRVAVLGIGADAAEVVRVGSLLREKIGAAILVAPTAPLDLTALEGVPTAVIAAGASPEGALVESCVKALPWVRSAPLPDLTEHLLAECDWLVRAGHLHPALGPHVAALLAELLG